MSDGIFDAEAAKTLAATRQNIGFALARNTALIAACRLATAVSALALIPIVVSTLGVGGYGVWEALVAVASLSLMFQGAISSTTIWQASAAFGAGRLEGVHRAARIGISATFLVLVLLVPMVWIWSDTIVRFLNVSDTLRVPAAALLPALVAVMVLGGITESLSAIVTAHQRAGVTSITAAAGLLGNYATVIAALHQGFGLSSLLIGYITNWLVQTTALYYVVRHISGSLRFVPAIPTVAELQSMGSYCGLILIGFVSASLRDQTDKIVIASMASPVWVGYYAIASRLAGLVLEVGRFFYVPTMAAIASLHSVGDWRTIQTIFARMMTAGALAACAVAVLVASHYDRLLVLWIGESPSAVAPMLLLLLVGNTVAVVLTGAGTSLCRAVGRVGIETTYVAVNLVTNVIMTVILVMLMGPIGTVSASALTWAASAVVFLVVLHRRLDLPTAGSFAAVRAIGAMVLTAALFHFAALTLPMPDTRLEALLSMCWLAPLTLAVYAVTASVMGVFSKADVSALLRQFQQSLSGRAMRLATVKLGE